MIVFGYVLPFVLSALLLMDSQAFAQRSPECEVERFMDDLTKFEDDLKKDLDQPWNKIRQFVSRCPDDGFWAEAYSEIITSVLAKKWKEFNNFLEVTAQDPKFYEFSLRHVDATTDSNNLKMIVKNAKNQCPKRASAICSRLEEEARTALREIDAVVSSPRTKNSLKKAGGNEHSR